MVDSRLRKPVSSVELCNAFLELMILLSLLELAEEDCFEYAYVFHPCDAASPAQLNPKQD